MDIKIVLSQLNSVKQTSSGWQACCPAHEDKIPSLSISLDGQRLLLYCHAGCRFEEILQALGQDISQCAYAINKGITGLKAIHKEGKIWLPVHDDKAIHGFQSIDSEGSKRFSKGTRVKGNYCLIGRPSGDIFLLCEGWATGRSLYRATGYPVIVAFSAQNLVHIASVVKVRWPAAEFIVCADNDKPGITSGEQAAAILGAKMTVPHGEIGFDFNDVESDALIREWVESARSVIWVGSNAAHQTTDGELRKRAALDEVVGWLIEREQIKFNCFDNKIEYNESSLKDSDLVDLRLRFKEETGLSCGRDLMSDAVLYVADLNSSDPLKDYYNGLIWKGIQRLDHLLTDGLGANYNPYTAEAGKRFAVSIVERALDPGKPHRVILVLSGPEDIGKSMFCRDLCPNPQWFSDYLPRDLGGKEAIEALLGKHIVESSELSGMRKSEQETVRAFLSRPSDHIRLPYARFPVDIQRRCVLIGTTNTRDPVPNDSEWTRIWPVAVTQYNRDYLLENREQLLAEAVVLYKSGYKWWEMDEATRKLFATNRDLFRASDHWETRLAAIGGEETNMATCLQVLGIPDERVNRGIETRIGNIMAKLGWSRTRVMEQGSRRHIYKRLPY